jgi:DNA invertase Pin-like site-specific DNA recombinase
MSFSAYRKKKAGTMHRNVQMPATKRRSVHPELSDNGEKPQTNLTPKKRKEPYKLCDELIERFCHNLRSCPGIPVEAICDSVGIARQTFTRDWNRESGNRAACTRSSLGR